MKRWMTNLFDWRGMLRWWEETFSAYAEAQGEEPENPGFTAYETIEYPVEVMGVSQILFDGYTYRQPDVEGMRRNMLRQICAQADKEGWVIGPAKEEYGPTFSSYNDPVNRYQVRVPVVKNVAAVDYDTVLHALYRFHDRPCRNVVVKATKAEEWERV